MSARPDPRQFYNPKLTPATLAMHLDPSWIPAKHLLYISKKVAAAVRRGGGRLIISVPPRHGKSRMLSIGGTVWTLENFEKYNVGLCTYGRDLSTDFSGAVRDQIVDNEDKLTCRIRQGSNRLDKFLMQGGGGVFAFGLGGALTGRGFNVFFLDDFIKQLKEALSATYRQNAWDWFTTTAYTRLEPGGTVVIIATRWHQDDLIGRIVKEYGDEWEYIQIPAIAKENDVLGRLPGEALFPERYPIEELMRTRRLLGSYWFSALYQQDPRDDTSKMANKDWLKYVSASEMPNPNLLRWVRVWDFAGLKGAGDYSAGALCGANKPEGRMYVADMIRGQYSPNDLDDIVIKAAEEDGKHVEVIILQEPGSSGLITVNHFKKLLPGYKVKGVQELEGKVSKAHSMLAGAERGDLYLQLGEWNSAFEDEFDDFPNADYDDQVDVVGVAWNETIGKLKIGATWGRVQPGATGQHPGATIRGTRTGGGGVTWGRNRSGLYVPSRRYG